MYSTDAGLYCGPTMGLVVRFAFIVSLSKARLLAVNLDVPDQLKGAS